jgi:uncharacterized MAPEG superfamily protein
MMDILIGCLFVAAILPFLAKVPVAIAMNKLGGYDNNHPRAQQSQLTGFGARALAAHQNAFEALIIFAPAILVAIATQHTGELIQQLAIAHVSARILYHIFYLLNFGWIRSLVWAVGLISSLMIIWQCMPV